MAWYKPKGENNLFLRHSQYMSVCTSIAVVNPSGETETHTPARRLSKWANHTFMLRHPRYAPAIQYAVCRNSTLAIYTASWRRRRNFLVVWNSIQQLDKGDGDPFPSLVIADGRA